MYRSTGETTFSFTSPRLEAARSGGVASQFPLKITVESRLREKYFILDKETNEGRGREVARGDYQGETRRSSVFLWRSNAPLPFDSNQTAARNRCAIIRDRRFIFIKVTVFLLTHFAATGMTREFFIDNGGLTDHYSPRRSVHRSDF